MVVTGITVVHVQDDRIIDDHDHDHDGSSIADLEDLLTW